MGFAPRREVLEKFFSEEKQIRGVAKDDSPCGHTLGERSFAPRREVLEKFFSEEKQTCGARGRRSKAPQSLCVTGS